MRIRDLAVAAALVGGLTVRSEAQRTGDRARIVFTISGGYVQRDQLWSVPSQPVQDFIGTSPLTDNFALSRGIMPALGAGLSGTYFPGEHFGLNGDAFLIGLGYEDNCRIVGPVQSAQNAAVCADINERERRAAAVTISGGGIFRLFSREAISPFLRVGAGLLFSSQSSILTEGLSSEGALVVVYDDDANARVSPSFAVGAGATMQLGRAYGLRWEVRDNIVGVERVTGATAGPRVEPPHGRTFKHLFSILIGLDVLLERDRGRRY
jgi:hypothetical protein